MKEVERSMSLEFSDKSPSELENMVKNYRDRGETTSDAYIEALRALESRRSKGLDLQKTLELVSEAARQRKYVTYKEVAARSGLEWNKIHWEVGKHLTALCEYAHKKGLPLLSAIVVNVDGVATGEMKAGSRAGFIEAARALGYQPDDAESFVKEQQERVFARFAPGATP